MKWVGVFLGGNIRNEACLRIAIKIAPPTICFTPYSPLTTKSTASPSSKSLETLDEK
jgi:hypothetical protein